MDRSTTSSREVIFAGIDFHKNFSVISLGDRTGAEVQRIKHLPNSEPDVIAFCHQYPGLVCAIEATRGNQWFIEVLKKHGQTVHVAHPYKIKLISESRRKCDKLDAKILMELTAKGFLPTSYQPSVDERDLRERLRWRVFIVRNSTRIKARLRCLLAQENLEQLLGKLQGTYSSSQLEGIEMSSFRRQQLFAMHLDALKQAEQRIRLEDVWVKNVAQSNPSAQLLMTAPGIGPFTALVILAELGDVSRFRRSSSVVNFAGIVPSLSSSAGKDHFGRLTKQGSPYLRWIMIQASWSAIRKDIALRSHFSSVSRRVGKHGAIVSVARKLLKIAYRMLRDNRPYDTQLIGKKID